MAVTVIKNTFFIVDSFIILAPSARCYYYK